jgi:hypothetical protein
MRRRGPYSPGKGEPLMLDGQYCGSEMFIPDPGSEFFPTRIPDFFHPGSQKFVSKLSEI